jgi:hypothetical protein
MQYLLFFKDKPHCLSQYRRLVGRLMRRLNLKSVVDNLLRLSTNQSPVARLGPRMGPVRQIKRHILCGGSLTFIIHPAETSTSTSESDSIYGLIELFKHHISCLKVHRVHCERTSVKLMVGLFETPALATQQIKLARFSELVLSKIRFIRWEHDGGIWSARITDYRN